MSTAIVTVTGKLAFEPRISKKGTHYQVVISVKSSQEREPLYYMGYITDKLLHAHNGRITKGAVCLLSGEIDNIFRGAGAEGRGDGKLYISLSFPKFSLIAGIGETVSTPSVFEGAGGEGGTLNTSTASASDIDEVPF